MGGRKVVRKAAAAGFVMVVAGALTLTGCVGGSDDSPSPSASAVARVTVESSPTPSVDPAEAARQADIENATAVYGRYIKVGDEIAQGGYIQPEAIDVYYGSPDALDFMRSGFEQLSAAGVTQTGSRKVLSTEITEYVGDPLDDTATRQIRLLACLDLSEVDLPDAEGVNHQVEGLPGSISADVLMQYFPEDSTTAKWKIITEEANYEECA